MSSRLSQPSTTTAALLLTLLPAGTAATAFQVDTLAQRRIEQGREQYERVKNDATQRACWDKAIAALHEGCRSIDDVERSRLAVQVWMRSASPTFEISHPARRP